MEKARWCSVRFRGLGFVESRVESRGRTVNLKGIEASGAETDEAILRPRLLPSWAALAAEKVVGRSKGTDGSPIKRP